MAAPKVSPGDGGISDLTNLLQTLGGTQTTTTNGANLTALQALLAQMQGQDPMKVLQTVFQQAGGQIPGLQAAMGNAVGARRSNNGALEASLDKLLQQTTLAGQQQVMQQQLQSQGIQAQIGGKIADATKTTNSQQGTNLPRAAKGMAALQLATQGLGLLNKTGAAGKLKSALGFGDDAGTSDPTGFLSSPVSYGGGGGGSLFNTGDSFSAGAGGLSDFGANASIGGGVADAVSGVSDALQGSDLFSGGFDAGSLYDAGNATGNLAGAATDIGGSAPIPDDDWWWGFKDGGLVGRDISRPGQEQGDADNDFNEGYEGEQANQARGFDKTGGKTVKSNNLGQRYKNGGMVNKNPKQMYANGGTVSSSGGRVGSGGSYSPFIPTPNQAQNFDLSTLGVGNGGGGGGYPSIPGQVHQTGGEGRGTEGGSGTESLNTAAYDPTVSDANAPSSMAPMDALRLALGIASFLGGNPISLVSQFVKSGVKAYQNSPKAPGTANVDPGDVAANGANAGVTSDSIAPDMGDSIGNVTSGGDYGGYGGGGYSADDGGGDDGSGGNGVPVQKVANGGKIKGPGTGTSDSIDAKVSTGEYVIPADVVQKVGVQFFDNLREKFHNPA